MIMALDLSTVRTGVCIGPIEDPKPVLVTTIKPPAKMELHHRIVYTAKAVMKLFYSNQCTFVIAEELMSMRNAVVVRALLRLHGAVLYNLVEARQAPPLWLDQNDIKESLGLKRGCAKYLVGEKIKQMGYVTKNDDEDDAVAVWEGFKALRDTGEPQ